LTGSRSGHLGVPVDRALAGHEALSDLLDACERTAAVLAAPGAGATGVGTTSTDV
jgi:hypothetical protein